MPDDTTYGAWWEGQIAAQRAEEAAASERVTTDEFCRRANVTLRPSDSADQEVREP